MKVAQPSVPHPRSSEDGAPTGPFSQQWHTGFDPLTVRRYAARVTDTVLDVRHLSIGFTAGGGCAGVGDDVSLAVPRGRTVALVVESGCGKSVKTLSLLRLLP